MAESLRVRKDEYDIDEEAGDTIVVDAGVFDKTEPTVPIDNVALGGPQETGRIQKVYSPKLESALDASMAPGLERAGLRAMDGLLEDTGSITLQLTESLPETTATDSDTELAIMSSPQPAQITTVTRPRRSNIYQLVDRYENGRRYHGYTEYWCPNDEKQNELLDIANHLYRLTLDSKLFVAPIGDNPRKVLDIGAGTGIWAMEFADQYPSAQIIGFDLSPVCPRRAAPNVQFEVKDACDPDWGYEVNSFDFIHARAMSGCVADWPAFYQQALAYLAPGGWYQQIEMSLSPTSDDGSVTAESALGKWGRLALEAGDRFGRDFRIYKQIEGYLSDAGFEDVVKLTYKWPIGPWSKGTRLKKIGMWNQVHWQKGIEGWSLVLLTRWSSKDVQLHLGKMQEALKDRKIHAYHTLNVVYGRKPRGPQR